MIRCLLVGLIFFISISAVSAQLAPNVVVSIRPIHSIVSALMDGVSEPKLLLDSNESAHTFHLKPSQLNMLSKADLVITIGDRFETGLSKGLRHIDEKSLLAVSEINDLRIYNSRNQDGISETEGHKDLHLWLDVDNVQIIAQHISERLIELDPGNTSNYKANFSELESKLNQLNEVLQLQLEPLKSASFAVFADRLQYLEKKFEMQKPVIITPYHGSRLSINKALKAKNSMKNLGVKCLIYGPENTSKQVAVLSEGLNINTHSVDIIGVKLNTGSEQYFHLMKEISSQLATCLE
jgi:zinc transport system substrate-binding protein